MSRLDPEQLDGPASYSVRAETLAQVVRNRVGVTATLFAAAIGSALLLGRRR